MSAVYAATAARIIREDLETEIPWRRALNRWIADSDRVLLRVEDANRADMEQLEDVLRARMHRLAVRLRRLGATVPGFADYRERHTAVREVQAAVDWIFEELQTAALRLKWPEFAIEPESEQEYTMADLGRWAELCRWLEEDPHGILRTHVPAELGETIARMRDRRIVYIQSGSRWRAYANWKGRLAQLRLDLEGSDG